MNGCNEVQSSLTEYLDGRLSGREMQEIGAHLQACRECSRESTSLRELQASLAGLGPVPEPPDLPLRIRVAVSQERAHNRRSIFTGWSLAWRNTLGPFLLQAGAGFASAVLLLGTIVVLVTVFAQPESAQATPDEPLGDATAPHLLYFSNAQGGNQADAVYNARWWSRPYQSFRRGLRLPHRLRTHRRAHSLPGGEPAPVQPLCPGPLLRPAGARIGGAVVLRRERAGVKAALSRWLAAFNLRILD